MTIAEDLSGKRNRKLVKVRPGVLKQANVHLGNFLSITTAMSNRACAQADTPEAAAAARKHFMQLFGEIVTTQAALSEAIGDTAGGEALQKRVDELKASDEYKEMIARAEADRISACYVFPDGERKESRMYPGELAFEVSLQQPCKDFGGWLISKQCSISGKTYAVLAVEYAPLKPPFAAGAKVRLVVRKVSRSGKISGRPNGVSWVRSLMMKKNSTEGNP